MVTVAGTLIYYLWVSYMPSYVHVTTGMPLDRGALRRRHDSRQPGYFFTFGG